MLWANTYTYEVRQHAAKGRIRRQETKNKWRPDRARVVEYPAEKEVRHHLKGLRDACRRFAARLDVSESQLADESSGENRRKDMGCGYGVLDSEIDTDASDRGHGVGRIADT